MTDRRAVDRSGPPGPDLPRPFVFPEFHRSLLAPGLELWAAPQRRVPLVQLELLARGGAQHDPLTAPGLASLTATLLDQGTRRRSAPEIAAYVEGVGGFLGTGADWDSCRVSLGLLSRHLRTGLDLLAELATEPTFPDEEVERARRQRLADLARRRDQPAVVADERAAQLLYAGTVYGNPLLGTEASVAAIARPAVDDFYRRFVAAGGAALVAVGDFTIGGLRAEAAEAFSGWRSAASPQPPIIVPPRPEGRRIVIVDRPRAAQTELRLALVGIARTHPDYLGLGVLNSLLGGKFTSRINLSLRERLGITYGAHSRVGRRLGPAPIAINTAVATANAGSAVRQVLHELDRLRSEAVDPAELEETQSYLLGVFPYTVQTVDGLADRLEELAVYGLPDDYFHRYAEMIGAVDRSTLTELARRYLDPELVTVVAVGPAAELERQLASFATAEVAVTE